MGTGLHLPLALPEAQEQERNVAAELPGHINLTGSHARVGWSVCVYCLAARQGAAAQALVSCMSRAHALSDEPGFWIQKKIASCAS